MSDTTTDQTQSDSQSEQETPDTATDVENSAEESTGAETDSESDTDTDEDDDDSESDDVEVNLARYKKKIGKSNREAQNLRNAKKALEAQLAELQPLIAAKKAEEEAKKTELDKALERIQQLESEGTKSARAAAEELAKEKLGVNDDQLAALPGSTFAEIKAEHERQQKLWGGVPKPKPDADSLAGGTNPKENGRDVAADARAAAMKVRLW